IGVGNLWHGTGGLRRPYLDRGSAPSTWGRRQFGLPRWEQADGQGRARGRSLVQLPLHRAVDQARLSDDRIVPWTQSRGFPRLGGGGERAPKGGGFPRLNKRQNAGRGGAKRLPGGRPAAAGVADGSRQQNHSQGFAPQQNPAAAARSGDARRINQGSRGRRRR